MSLKTFALTAILAGIQLASAATTTTSSLLEVASSKPILGTDTVHGCYGSIGSLVFNQSYTYNSQGACAGFCRGIGKYVGATQASNCYCGDSYPPENTLVGDAECTEPCPGYDTQACGGLNVYTVYNTGVLVDVASDANVTTTTSSSSVATSTTAATVTAPADSAASATTTSGTTKSSSNTVGIAVGAVVGVVGSAALAGIVFFMLRRRRNREIEEEHRRNAAVSAFMAGGKPPSSSGGFSISDQRLDPVMVQRRMSSGSIADEQDYSRRILRVTNA